MFPSLEFMASRSSHHPCSKNKNYIPYHEKTACTTRRPGNSLTSFAMRSRAWSSAEDLVAALLRPPPPSMLNRAVNTNTKPATTQHEKQTAHLTLYKKTTRLTYLLLVCYFIILQLVSTQHYCFVDFLLLHNLQPLKILLK